MTFDRNERVAQNGVVDLVCCMAWRCDFVGVFSQTKADVFNPCEIITQSGGRADDSQFPIGISDIKGGLVPV